ncbi:SMI1/KNR4 family protein [Streptomyces sp. NPDC101152]|uniref:SMI1/KNR4 family protein n=1 Tax=Streptomyces sp. NPDC101152 TaxID=3366116 RepID=UPI0038186EBA
MNTSSPEAEYRFEELWQRLESWLIRNAPEDHQALLPGASGAEISNLEREIGFSVNDDLKLLLSRHNGVAPRRSSMQAGAFLLGYSLLGTGGILERQQYVAAMAREAVEDGYEDEVIGRIAHERWVPFAQSLTGDLLFVDHRSDHHGDVGEISFGAPEYVWLWPSMRLMLHDLCDSVEGASRLPTLRRRPSVHEGRMLEWVTD